MEGNFHKYKGLGPNYFYIPFSPSMYDKNELFLRPKSSRYTHTHTHTHTYTVIYIYIYIYIYTHTHTHIHTHS